MESENDPFAGLTSAERKRAYERITLEFIYRPTDYLEITERERPDFALRAHRASAAFGVEITQMFPHEAFARLHLMPGYTQSLWDKTRTPFKKDAATLKVSDVTVTDADGNVKYENLTVIITEPHKREDFRTELARTIEHKSGLDYDFTEFSHINLIVLDWFHMRFNAKNYSTAVLFDDRVREALRMTPFREVHLLIHDTGPEFDETDESTPEARSDSSDVPLVPKLMQVPLKQLLLIERFYATCQLISEHLAGTDHADDAAYLSRLTCGFVTRCIGVGTAVAIRGLPHVRFGAAAMGLSAEGIRIFDHQDWPHEDTETLEIAERLPADVETGLIDSLAQVAFTPGLSEDTLVPPSRPLAPTARTDS